MSLPFGALALAALVGAVVVTVLSVGGIWTHAGTLQFIFIIAAVLLTVVAVAGRSVSLLRAPGPLAQQHRLVLALAVGVVAIALLSVAASFGYGWLFYPVLLVAAVVFLGRLAAGRLARGRAPRAQPAVTPVPASTGAGRMRIARLFAVLGLVCLACGSTLVAILMTWLSVAWVTGGAPEDPGLAFALFFLMTWPPTFVLTWAFGTAAFMAKGTLDPLVAVLAFVAGMFGSLFLLAPVSAVPGGAVVLLVALNVGAAYFVRREFWAPPRPPANVARLQTRPLS